MIENEVLTKEVDVLTSKEVIIKIDVNAHNDKLGGGVNPKEYRFKIRPIVVGNIYRISSRILQIPSDVFDKSLFETFLLTSSAHLDDLIYIIAVAVQNNHKEPSDELLNIIRWNFTPEDFKLVLEVVLSQIQVESFLSSIISIKTMNVIRMSPRENAEIIAHSE